MEDGEQRVQVSGVAGSDEGVDDRPLAGKVPFKIGDLGAADATSCPAPQLPGCLGGSVHQRTDLLEGQVEHVVEHERKPLCRREGVEHHLEGEADRVGHERLVLGKDVAAVGHDGVGEEHTGDVLSPSVARAQGVEADPGDDGGQPSAQALDPVRAGTMDALPGVLNGVNSVGERAEHPVGHGRCSWERLANHSSSSIPPSSCWAPYDIDPLTARGVTGARPRA
jgi:hypothetical protein